jgi:hypothetical protein
MRVMLEIVDHVAALGLAEIRSDGHAAPLGHKWAEPPGW